MLLLLVSEVASIHVEIPNTQIHLRGDLEAFTTQIIHQIKA